MFCVYHKGGATNISRQKFLTGWQDWYVCVHVYVYFTFITLCPVNMLNYIYSGMKLAKLPNIFSAIYPYKIESWILSLPTLSGNSSVCLFVMKAGVKKDAKDSKPCTCTHATMSPLEPLGGGTRQYIITCRPVQTTGLLVFTKFVHFFLFSLLQHRMFSEYMYSQLVIDSASVNCN